MDPSFSSNALRVANRKQLLEILTPAMARFPINTLLEELNRVNVPAGRIQSLKDVFELPEAQELLLKNNDSHSVKTFVAQLSESDIGFSHFLPPPFFGQHTHQILTELLQIPSANVVSLQNQGVIN